MSDFTDAVEGFDLGDSVGRTWNAGQTDAAPVSSVTGIVTQKLRQVRSLTGFELPFLKAHCPLPIKMTLPSPTQFPAIAFKRGVTDRVYPDPSALLWDVVEIMKSDLSELSSEGVAYLVEQRPRMQSRAEVIALRQGSGVLFAVHNRTVQGKRGAYRVNMRHGVSRVESGRRHTVGIIFHDAKQCARSSFVDLKEKEYCQIDRGGLYNKAGNPRYSASTLG
jgi:hypothetical protein